MTGSSAILTAKIALLCIVGFTTLASALTPWFAAGFLATRKALDFIRVAAAASAGIIVGTLLCHMLPHATEAFSAYLTAAYPDADPHDHDAEAGVNGTAARRLVEELLETNAQRIVHYPWAHMICGGMLLLLLVVDYIFAHGLSGHSHGQSDGNGGDGGGSAAAGDHDAGGHDHVTGGVVALGKAMEASKAAAAAPGEVAVEVSSAEPRPLPVCSAGEAATGGAASASVTDTPSGSRASPSARGSEASCNALLASGGSSSPSASSSGSSSGSGSGSDSGSSNNGSSGVSTSGSPASTDADAVAAIAVAAAIAPVASGQIAAAATNRGAVKRASTSASAAVVASSAESDDAASADTDRDRDRDEPPPATCRESCIAVLGCSRSRRDHKMALLVGQTAGSQRQLRVRAWVFAMAMSIHAVFDGLGVGVQTTAGGFSSLIAAVFVHKIFDGISLGATVFLGDLPPCQRWFLLLLTSSLTPIGIGIGIAVVETADTMALELATGIILSLAAGSFAFIGLIELLPSALADGRLMPLKLGVFGVGYLVMAIIAAWA